MGADFEVALALVCEYGLNAIHTLGPAERTFCWIVAINESGFA
jgi:hypothetical protein